MIPGFVSVPGAPWPLLPPGIHDATLEEVCLRYATNPKRQRLFQGMGAALENLFRSGCPQVFLDGSYVTAKPLPNDYEIVWDVRFVNPDLLDPLFLDFSNGTINQKRKYLGEFFPSMVTEARSLKPFIEFFQTDRETGKPKGIVRLINHIKKGGSL